MACVADESQIEIDIHGRHVEAPSRYVYSVASSSSSCNVAVGSHSLMSKKVKARKLPMVERFDVEGSGGVSDNGDCCHRDDYKLLRPEIVRVYCRRRKRSPRGSGDAESLKLDERNQKRRRIGEDSSGLRSCLRGCSGDKQNGASRRKGSSVKNQDKVSIASDSTRRWLRLGFISITSLTTESH